MSVTLFSCTRAFGDGPRNFEPWSSDQDDTHTFLRGVGLRSVHGKLSLIQGNAKASDEDDTRTGILLSQASEPCLGSFHMHQPHYATGHFWCSISNLRLDYNNTMATRPLGPHAYFRNLNISAVVERHLLKLYQTKLP
ncbi:hypothetical protein TNCV_4123821 [Trichonephila clavipes]|nr:hypothetical protein TNCV_4123821 [Trichonephila clavipes]